MPYSSTQRRTILCVEHLLEIELGRVAVAIAVVVVDGEDVVRRKGTSVFGAGLEILRRATFGIDGEARRIARVEAIAVPACVEDADAVEASGMGGVEDLTGRPVVRLALIIA